MLLQNATEIYYKMRQVFYYKMRQLLQIVAILLQNATGITKCNVYYKLRQYTRLTSQLYSFHLKNKSALMLHVLNWTDRI